MKRSNTRIGMKSVAFTIGALGLISSSGHAEPFLFQGQLNDMGQPANGVYDLTFTLHSIDTGGTPIGSTIIVDNHVVTDGQFSVELDFGDSFDGSARWIETGVRNGDSSGSYTTLLPRMKVGSAPQAGFATKAATAETLNEPFWTQAPGILYFGEDEGNDKFFFNRNRVIDSTDVFVVHSAMGGPGGMNLSSWANGMPYYGYATGGFTRAKTYYDPATSAWVVNKGGEDQIEIDQNNDVVITNNLIVGGTITSSDGPTTTTQYKSFTPESIFIGLGNNTFFNAIAGAIVSSGSPAGSYLRTDLDLPHGATITTIEVQYVDANVSPDLQVQLSTRNLASMGFNQTLLGASTGSNGSNVQTLTIQPNPAIVVDNTVQTYDLRFLPSTGFWPTNGSLGVRSVLVEYTLP